MKCSAPDPSAAASAMMIVLRSPRARFKAMMRLLVLAFYFAAFAM
jgi:hypothetical protein